MLTGQPMHWQLAIHHNLKTGTSIYTQDMYTGHFWPVNGLSDQQIHMSPAYQQYFAFLIWNRDFLIVFGFKRSSFLTPQMTLTPP